MKLELLQVPESPPRAAYINLPLTAVAFTAVVVVPPSSPFLKTGFEGDCVREPFVTVRSELVVSAVNNVVVVAF